MKRFLTIAALLLYTTLAAQAQDSKTIIYDKISNSYSWLNATMLIHSADLKMTSAQWDYCLKNENTGLSTLSSLGSDMSRYLTFTTPDTRLRDDCDNTTDNAGCFQRVKELSPKIKVEADFTKVTMVPDHFKLAMYALSNVGSFLGSSNIYGPNSGWKPKGSNLRIILSFDNDSGQPVVSWNKDFTEARVKMFVASEAGDWAANMMKGLNKGGSK